MVASYFSQKPRHEIAAFIDAFVFHRDDRLLNPILNPTHRFIVPLLNLCQHRRLSFQCFVGFEFHLKKTEILKCLQSSGATCD